MNQLKALIVGAPEELRAELRGLATKQQILRCAALRDRAARSLKHRMTGRALRSAARRIQFLAAEAAELRAELDRLVARRPAPLGGRVCPGGGQPHPGPVRADHQASVEPLGRWAAEPGPAHHRARKAAGRRGHPRLRRSPAIGRQERPRHPPVLEASRRPPAVQAAGTLRSRKGPDGDGLIRSVERPETAASGKRVACVTVLWIGSDECC